MELIRDHVTELNNQRPKQPFFFLKPASSILLPGEGPVIRPKGVNLHYEVELALIMGKRLKNLEASDEKGAMDAIESTFSFPLPLHVTTAYAILRHNGIEVGKGDFIGNLG